MQLKCFQLESLSNHYAEFIENMFIPVSRRKIAARLSHLYYSRIYPTSGVDTEDPAEQG